MKNEWCMTNLFAMCPSDGIGRNVVCHCAPSNSFAVVIKQIQGLLSLIVSHIFPEITEWVVFFSAQGFEGGKCGTQNKKEGAAAAGNRYSHPSLYLGNCTTKEILKYEYSRRNSQIK